MAKLFIAIAQGEYAFTGNSLEEVYAEAVEGNEYAIGDIDFYEAEKIEVEVKVIKKTVPVKAPNNTKSK